MDRRLKYTAIALLLASLLSAVALASSLPNLRLGPGQPFPGAGSQSADGAASAAERAAASAQSWSVFTGILAVVLASLFIYILVRLITFADLKRLAGAMLLAALVLFLLLSLPHVESGSPTILQPESIATASAPPESAVTPLGEPPTSLFWAVGVLILVGAGTLAAFALRRRPPAASHLVLKEARRAVRDLRSGMDSTDVVIRCYLQMTQAVREQRGIERGRSLTVREFESVLDSVGLPPRPLLRLRELFEAVRYGNRSLTADENSAATESLGQIIAALEAGAS